VDPRSKQPRQRLIHHGLWHQALRDGIGIGLGRNHWTLSKIGAVRIHTVLQRYSHRLGQALGEVMTFINIPDSGAIGCDIAFEIPGAPQQVVQQKITRTGGLAIHPVVGAHQRAGLAFHNRGPEGRRISVNLVVLADGDIHRMAGRLRPGMHGIVFWRGNGAGMC
jgi:hypothetical protein